MIQENNASSSHKAVSSSCPCKYTALAALGGALLLLFCASPQSHARPEKAAQVETRFQAMDKDKDGKVSREEFFAAHPQMKEGAFVSLDTDKDGFLSLDEWRAFAADHGSEGRGGMGGMGGSGMGGSGPMGGMMPPANTNATGGSAPAGMPGLIMPSGK